jgi:hypothetical protein
MSSDIFKYLIEANEEQQEDLGIIISETVQQTWSNRLAGEHMQKCDDLGDSFLHAVDELLCGSTSYRQLIPAMPALHINRTVVIAVLPDYIYWAVIHCTWNLFVIENLGVTDTSLPIDAMFSSPETVQLIKNRVDLEGGLKMALTNMDESALYSGVDHIKTVVKQLTIMEDHGLMERKLAGALTNSTVEVAKQICDGAATTDSILCVRNIKPLGWSYTRTLASNKKFKVIRSTGKHTNAMMSCLEWAKKNVAGFVEKRELHLNRIGKLAFFNLLQQLSMPGMAVRRLEMLSLSDDVASKIESGFHVEETRAMLADLILIGLNMNSQFVSAIASSYR